MCLVLAGSASLALSLIVQSAQNVCVGIGLYVVNMLLSNCLFGAFIAIARGVRWGRKDFLKLVKCIPLQLAISVVITFFQSLLVTVAGYAGMAGLGAQTLASVCVSLLITLVSVSVAFALYDGERGFSRVLRISAKSLSCNFSNILYPAAPFLAWSFLLNLAYSSLGSYFGVSSTLDLATAGVGGVGFLLLGNLASYFIAGYFEIDVLLGLAMNYEKVPGLVGTERCR